MNLLTIAGGVLCLAGALLMHVSDWKWGDRRLLRWSWWPVTAAGVFALIASKAGGVRIAETLAVAVVGGVLISIAFISQATGHGWQDVIAEMLRRQNRRKS